MKNMIMILLLLCAANVVSAQTEAPSAFQKLTLDEALQKAGEEKKKLLVFVSASWVGIAKTMKSTTLTDQEVIAAMDKGYVSIELDADEDEAFIQKHRIQSLPVILIFDSDHKETDRITGAVGKTQLLDRLLR